MFLVAVLGAVIAAPPAAQSPLAPIHGLDGRVLLAGCRQGGCSWRRVVRVERIDGNAHGELRRITSRDGSSEYGMAEPPSRYSPRLRIAWEAGDRSDYVFCSRERPAFAFRDSDGPGFITHFLDLYQLFGYQYSSAEIYMRACHGEGLPVSPASLRRLGYRPGTRSEQVEDRRPEDLLRF